MEHRATKYLFAARSPTTNEPTIISYGEMGYTPANPRLNVEHFNGTYGWTPEEVESAQLASCFGWHTPSAQPAIDAVLKRIEAANKITPANSHIELVTALENLIKAFVNPGDGLPFEDGEVPALDAARRTLANATGSQAYRGPLADMPGADRAEDATSTDNLPHAADCLRRVHPANECSCFKAGNDRAMDAVEDSYDAARQTASTVAYPNHTITLPRNVDMRAYESLDQASLIAQLDRFSNMPALTNIEMVHLEALRQEELRRTTRPQREPTDSEIEAYIARLQAEDDANPPE